MKIFLTGGTGMVGKNILEHPKAKKHIFYAPTHQELDLLDADNTRRSIAYNDVDIVIHTAGLVGGIQANNTNMFDFMHKNLVMGMNVVDAAHKAGVKRLINLGSSCMYPDKPSSQDLKEEDILTGPFEPTNEGYGIAKVAIAKACSYITKENPGYQYKTYIPCNLFGRWDHFDSEKSHLLPAIIKKIYDARATKNYWINVWGDGTPKREVMDAADLADFIFFSLDIFDEVPDIINISPGEDHSIETLYYLATRYLLTEEEQQEVIFLFDKTKPNGMMKKMCDVSKLKKLKWEPKTNLKDAFEKSYAFYSEQVASQNKKETQK